jgi:hypothetical protein
MTNHIKPGQFIEVTEAELHAIHKKTLDDHERLRDAAPDLLEALKEMTDIAHQVDCWQSFPLDPIEKARAAIAKATGAEQ